VLLNANAKDCHRCRNWTYWDLWGVISAVASKGGDIAAYQVGIGSRYTSNYYCSLRSKKYQEKLS